MYPSIVINFNKVIPTQISIIYWEVTYISSKALKVQSKMIIKSLYVWLGIDQDSANFEKENKKYFLCLNDKELSTR